MTRLGGRLVVGGLALLVSLPCLAAKKPASEPASAAPAWAREAAATKVPGDLSGNDSEELLDEWIVAPLPEGGVRKTHRRVVRVLRPEGLRDATGVSLLYRSDDRVESVAAWNMLPDGTMRRPDRDEDVVDVPYTSGGATVDDVRLRRASLPGAVVGSVAAFETIVVDGIDKGGLIVTFGDTGEPVGACRLTLTVPAGWTFADKGLRAEAFTRSATATGVTWSAASVARPPREDWSPPHDEILPRLGIAWRSPEGSRGFADWNALAAWYRNLTAPVVKDAGDAAAVSARLKPADAASFGTALRDAFAFSSRDVRYVAIEMGIGGYRPQAPAFTCSNRYGDCKAKAFLFKSVVEPWGWKAHPVLVLTHDAGSVVPELPALGQFNHCIVALEVPPGLGADAWNAKDVEGAGRLAFLDPTTTDLGPWQLRPDDQGTTALVVLPDRGVLVDLPIQPPEAAVTDVRLEATVDERGQVTTGSVRARYAGTGAGAQRAWYSQLRADQVKDAMQRWLQAWVPGANLTEHAVEGADSLDGDFVETARFSGGRIAQRAGDLLIVQAPVAALPVPAARLPPPPRASRLDLGLPEERRIEVSITAPPGWIPEKLPRPVSRTAPQFTLECAWERTEAGFVLRGAGRQLVRSVEAADYAAFRDAARLANSAENEGVVLVKAPAAGQ